MIEELFPGAISRLIIVKDAWEGLPKIKDKNIGHTWIDVKPGSKTETSLLSTPPGGKVGSFGGSKKLNFNKIAGTISTGGLLPGYPGSSWPSHPLELRGISYREAARCSSFPDSFNIRNGQLAARCIGNSVPPFLMKAIAIQIRYKLWGGDPLTRYPKTMAYPEILEAAWQDHLAPREPNAPTVISTCAGGGGSSLGYSMAGYRELLAVEWDDNAVETFKLNFPDVPVYHGDIAKLSVEECLQLAGVKEEELDLLDSSPPCQGLSSAGKRDLNDPRNQLFHEFVRLLRGLKPKVFVMENVPGLVKGKMKLIFAEIMRELKASGYQVRCKKLNAMYFYVPQSRERLIFIGVRNNLGLEASHPKAESRPVTVREAVMDIRDMIGQKSPIASSLKKKRWNNTKRGGNHKDRFSLSRLTWNKPSVTIQKTATGSTGLMHPDQPRELHEFELKRIGSFPDNYLFSGKWINILNRIGDSVPPLLMRSIADHVKLIFLISFREIT